MVESEYECQSKYKVMSSKLSQNIFLTLHVALVLRPGNRSCSGKSDALIMEALKQGCQAIAMAERAIDAEVNAKLRDVRHVFTELELPYDACSRN